MVRGPAPCRRRLCRPRPVLLALAAVICLFCHSLTPLGTSRLLSAVVQGISPRRLAAQPSPADPPCLPPSAQALRQVSPRARGGGSGSHAQPSAASHGSRPLSFSRLLGEARGPPPLRFARPRSL